MVLLHFGRHVSIIFPLFFFFYGQGTSSGNSTGIAHRARHPDELKREDGKWMIDIDYYLSQQVLFCFCIFSIKLSNKCSHLLLPFYCLIEGLIYHTDSSCGITSLCVNSRYKSRTLG
jgi:hypothetical protein